MDYGPVITDREILLRSKGAGRYVGAAFLFVWLCGWVIGEAFALFLLIRGAIALLSGTPPAPGREPLEWGPALAAGAFLLVWLTLWTLGGILAIGEFLRLMWGTDRLAVHGGDLEMVRSRGVFRSRRVIPRDSIRRLALMPRNDRLAAETRSGVVELSTLGTRAEREEARALLATLLGLGDVPTPADASLPPEWQEIITPEGERALVPNLATRRVQARVAGVVTLAAAGTTWGVARAAVRDLPLLAPAVLLLALTVALACGTAWLVGGRNEWRIGSGRLVLRRRFGARVEDRFEAHRLELTVSSDSDGDDWFSLEAVTDGPGGAGPPDPPRPGRPSPVRRTIARVMHDATMPRRLGEWLARAASVPLEDRSTREARQAELAVLRAQLEASGRFGKWAAKALDRIGERRSGTG